jgi:hypothetical protein
MKKLLLIAILLPCGLHAMDLPKNEKSIQDQQLHTSQEQQHLSPEEQANRAGMRLSQQAAHIKHKARTSEGAPLYRASVLEYLANQIE